MAKKREAEALFFVLFLDYWQGAEAPPPPFHVTRGATRGVLWQVDMRVKTHREPESGRRRPSPPMGAGANAEFLLALPA